MQQGLLGEQHWARTAGSLGGHCDHVVAFGWSDPIPGMFFTVDLILHQEMALLFQVGATDSAQVTQGGGDGPAAS